VIRWHLCNLNGQSTRIVEADSLFWAKRRLAPIPKGWMVISDASYRTPAYQVAPELVDVCTKCLRHPRVVGYNQCYDCASHKRNGYRRKVTKKVDHLTLEQRKERWREARAKQHATITADPERVAKRSARLSAAQKARYEKERERYRMSRRQAYILAGIERRKAKREQLTMNLGA
jgi:hypothetical protein